MLLCCLHIAYFTDDPPSNSHRLRWLLRRGRCDLRAKGKFVCSKSVFLCAKNNKKLLLISIADEWPQTTPNPPNSPQSYYFSWDRQGGRWVLGANKRSSCLIFVIEHSKFKTHLAGYSPLQQQYKTTTRGTFLSSNRQGKGMTRGKVPILYCLFYIFVGINSNPQAVNLSHSLFPNKGEWKDHYKWPKAVIIYIYEQWRGRGNRCVEFFIYLLRIMNTILSNCSSFSVAAGKLNY
jgi:hypothetical protein